MDTARQILRFSIPGSITLLLVAAFLVLGRLFQGDSWEAVGDAVRDNVSVAVVIFGAIPVGFLIYQIYYTTYRAVVWPWRPRPFVGGERWVRIDRGAQILGLLPVDQRKRIEDLFDVKLQLGSILEPELTVLGRIAHAYRLKPSYVRANRKNPAAAYRRRWKENWNVVRALVEISDASGHGATIRSEYITLSDIYHALGACRAGVQLAWVISLLACVAYVIDGQSFFGSALTVGTTLVFTFLLFWVFHRARGHTWVSAQESLKFGLTALFKRHPNLLDPELEKDAGRIKVEFVKTPAGR